MTQLARYGRVALYEGKHGLGDFRVEFAGAAPTHGEVLALLYWLFMAEDRYRINGQGRRWLWWHVRRAYEQDVPLGDILRDADGTAVANERGAVAV